MIKVSDYVSEFLVARGIEDLFLVSGGGIMHLLESVGRQEGLRYWCNYHEQACAVAAEAWAKVRRRPCAVLVTVGPGGLNALSGAAGAWFDSVPMLVFTGQVRRELIADYSRQRQKGPQEGDLVGLAGHLTKYAVTLRDPGRIRYELEKAWHLATSGRPGPVLIDLPLDIQGAMVDETTLVAYTPSPAPGTAATLVEAARTAADWIRASRRPVIMAGNGVGWSGAGDALLELLAATGIPAITTHTAKDLLWEDHPQNLGCFGPLGQRRANFTLQNADLLLSLGSGLCVAKSGFNVASFSPGSRKILVDIDPGQLHHQPVVPDLAVAADAGAFIQALSQALGAFEAPRPWLEACAQWKARYPTLEAEHQAPSACVNTYRLLDRLSDHLDGEDTIVTGNGMDVVSYIQSFRITRGQRALQNGNWGPMGWDLPLAVGAAVASPGHRVVLVTGDGSFQWNVQELLTLGSHRLPVCIFVLNNQGYSSIRTTQNAYFGGHFVGAEAGSGVANPDFRPLAGAYGLAYDRIDPAADLDAELARVLAGPMPRLCEVPVAPDQPISPKASSSRRPDGTMESRPLEDMFPFLPRAEIKANMAWLHGDA